MSAEYELMPLAASATEPADSTYGSHPIPLDPELTSFELPQLIAQKVDGCVAGEDWRKWGRWKRAEQGDAFHFYCVDSKFEGVLRDPFKLLDTGAAFAVEVNVSSYANDPLPVALAGLWRKRCVSKLWQEQGVNIFIDLFVDGWTRDLVLDGVPRDHCLYATKYAKTDLSGNPLGLAGVVEDFELVLEHSTDPDNLIFAVYGGGKKMQEICERNQWLWLPPFNQQRGDNSDG